MSYDLSRFHAAQARDYDTALSEIRAGRKRSHWIWYIFPQIRGLGYSSTAQYYALEDLGEAKAYLADPVLRQRLLEISGALLDCPVFPAVLRKFYRGEPDERTLALAGANL